MPLALLQRKFNLSDEDVVVRFFKNIKSKPQDKDYYIKDFEDFYFKIRPKFSIKLIRVFLEVSLPQPKLTDCRETSP